MYNTPVKIVTLRNKKIYYHLVDIIKSGSLDPPIRRT
jgi:hypothetical protein